MKRAITFAIAVGAAVYALMHQLGTPEGWARALAPATAFTAGSLAWLAVLVLAAIREFFD